MDKILIDSDALFAFYHLNDPHHQTATRTYLYLQKAKNVSLYLTNLVIYETATLLSYRINHKEAIQFIKEVFKSNLQYIFINETLSEKTLSFFLVQTKKRTSFVDCANAVVMKEFKIDKIFSFDEFYGDKRLKT